jgi:hypothetical protein
MAPLTAHSTMSCFPTSPCFPETFGPSLEKSSYFSFLILLSEVHHGCRHQSFPCMSWEFRDSSHGDGLTEGLDGGDDGSGSGLCQRRHLGYPGLGTSMPEVKPLLPACFLLSSHWLQRSSSCSSRGGTRRLIGSPRLRVQTPLYRQGSGYRLGGRCPAAGSPWLRLRRDLLALLCPLLTVALYKASFPPWTDI